MGKTFLIELLRAVIVAFCWICFISVSWQAIPASWTDAQARMAVFVTLVLFMAIGNFLPKLVDAGKPSEEVPF